VTACAAIAGSNNNVVGQKGFKRL